MDAEYGRGHGECAGNVSAEWHSLIQSMTSAKEKRGDRQKGSVDGMFGQQVL